MSIFSSEPFERLDRTLHVGFDDDVQFLDFAFLDLLEQIFQRDAGVRAHARTGACLIGALAPRLRALCARLRTP